MRASALRMSSKGRSALILLPLLVVSCIRSDRVAIVACNETSAAALPVKVKVVPDSSTTSEIGYLNTWNLSLGQIVELSPESSPLLLVNKVGSPSISLHVLSKRFPYVGATVADNVFRVHVDSDVLTMTQRAGVQLDYGSLKHPTVDLETPIVRSITNIDSIINADKALAERIRDGNGARYAIVSQTVDGDDINFYFDLSQPVVNSYHFDGTYLHVKYLCASVDEIRIHRRHTSGPVPIIIFLSPIIFDQSDVHLMTVTQNGAAVIRNIP